jgi:hypothetical protein
MLSALLLATTLLLSAAKVAAHLSNPRAQWTVAAGILSSQYLLYGLYPSDVSLSAVMLMLIVLLWRPSDEKPTGLRSIAIGLLAGAMTATKVTNAPLVFLCPLVRAFEPHAPNRHRDALLMAAAAVPGLSTLLWWNLIRTGHVLQFPYASAHSFALQNFALGVCGTLISPAKGLLVYSPSLLVFGLLAFRRRSGDLDPWTIATFMSLFIAIVRLAGTEAWTSWGGWGIRYYVPWIPALLTALVIMGAGRSPGLLGWTIVLWGGIENLAGVLTNFHYRQSLCGFLPWTFSGTNACALVALPSNLARTFGVSIPDVVVPGASAANIFSANRLAVWWYSARAIGLTPGISWTIGGLLIGCASASLFASYRLQCKDALSSQGGFTQRG